jgi:hypothetical protein
LRHISITERTTIDFVTSVCVDASETELVTILAAMRIVEHISTKTTFKSVNSIDKPFIWITTLSFHFPLVAVHQLCCKTAYEKSTVAVRRALQHDFFVAYDKHFKIIMKFDYA